MWGAPGSVLGPILFNIYLNDLFFQLADTHVCTFADDTTLNGLSPNGGVVPPPQARKNSTISRIKIFIDFPERYVHQFLSLAYD